MEASDLLFGPVRFLIRFPWVIAVIGVALLIVGFAFRKGGWAVKLAAICWAAYAVWENWVQYQTPDADIRVDLLLIAPILLVVSIMALVALFVRRKRDG
ncbi:MAG: hypothetical protein KDJ80_05425 [Nitratireductor sp.]|nr:hypothetical protein [Nitratireductor sp.]